ncbi:MAG: hypothetical protein ABFD69_00025 [Candidatus Sumerlaeia bacterium]
MGIEIDDYLNGVWTIAVAVEDGKDRFRQYLDELKDQKKYDQLDAIVAELQSFSKRGQPRSREKFKPEGDGVFAIKCFQERVYGFFAGKNRFACVAGASKKKNKADQGLLKIVKRIKSRYERERC